MGTPFEIVPAYTVMEERTTDAYNARAPLSESGKKEGMAIAQNLEGKRWKAVEGDRHHPERRTGFATRRSESRNRHVAPLGSVEPDTTHGGVSIGGF